MKCNYIAILREHRPQQTDCDAAAAAAMNYKPAHSGGKQIEPSVNMISLVGDVAQWVSWGREG